MKKIFFWLFQYNLELEKRWLHRLIKVVFLSIFSLVTITSFIAALISEPDLLFFRKHNMIINNTLYQFTENYAGSDLENTIPEFFEQKGIFGVLIDNRVSYISLYSLGKSAFYNL